MTYITDLYSYYIDKEILHYLYDRCPLILLLVLILDVILYPHYIDKQWIKLEQCVSVENNFYEEILTDIFKQLITMISASNYNESRIKLSIRCQGRAYHSFPSKSIIKLFLVAVIQISWLFCSDILFMVSTNEHNCHQR